MRIDRIDHVGIAVADVEAAITHYTRLLGVAPVHRAAVEHDGIEAVMFRLGETRVELIAPLRSDSAVTRFLGRHGPGLHHVAYAVDDVQGALDEARGWGLRRLDDCPRQGAAGAMVGFLHPSAGLGVLTEFCQRSEAP